MTKIFIKYHLTLVTSILTINTLIAQNELIINEYMASNASVISDSTGQTHDWIELFNNSPVPIYLEGYHLSDDIDDFFKWAIPSLEIPAYGYKLIWASSLDQIDPWGEIHTNFSIKSEGEGLFLSNPDGDLIDASAPTYLGPDISYGRIPGEMNWYYFENATPGFINGTTSYTDQTNEPLLSHEPGLYSSEFFLELSPEHPEDILKFTVDGSKPSMNSLSYMSPIEIDNNTVLRVKVFRENALSIKIFTYSFLLESDFSLDIISLVTDEANLFGTSGIYTLYNIPGEVPIHVEYFKQNGTEGFHADMGVQIHAPDSRDQKSLRLHARSEYGDNEINYQLFEEKDIDVFKRIILRNGGNDGTELDRTHIRDAYVHELYKKQDPFNGYAAYEPLHVFINGAYWGIYNMRERQDEHYIRENFGFFADEVDFLEYDYTADNDINTFSGNWEDWDSLKTFIIDEDLSLESNYDIISDWIDIENFIDYQVFEIHIGNQDWLNNNIRFWKPYEDGKWKWVLWDTEYGLGNYTSDPIGYPDFNFMNMAMSWGGWGNGDHTWMLRNLMDNEAFRIQFLKRYQDLLNTTFKPDYAVQEFDKLVDYVSSDIDHQLNRWNSNLGLWESALDHARFFIQERPFYERIHIAEQFDLSTESNEIFLDVSDPAAGYIRLNTIVIDNELLGWEDAPYPWNGKYLKDVEIELEAIPNEGYQFSHWSGSIETYDPHLSLLLSEPMSFTAIFVPEDNTPVPPLYINEIMTQNSNVYADESGDFESWIELYNAGENAIDISGLYITDDLNNPLKWEILDTQIELTTVDPDGHLVLFADLEVFVSPLHLNFELDPSEGEIGLFFKNSSGDILFIDAMDYTYFDEITSYGRVTDGSENWVYFDVPTPNAMNQVVSSLLQPIRAMDLLVYPNPVGEIIYIQQNSDIISDYYLSVMDLYGKVILTDFVEGQSLFQLNISELKSGIYLLELRDRNDHSFQTKKLVKK